MSNLEKFNDMMNRYRAGEFGQECLSMYEILRRSNNADLLDKLSILEIQSLIDMTSGITKEMFIMLKKKKMKCGEPLCN